MLSDKFRRQLRQEAEQWRTEGLIDASVYEQLSNRYQFSDIETAARNRFTLILLGLGSVLLGLGIITFVAANWQVWSREWKVLLLLSGFVGINAAGFYLWRRPTERWQRRLGQGLLLLGALVLGANIALMSQLFHQSGLLYQLFIVWGLGVLAMAYSLRLTLLGILAELLIGLGYLQGQPAFVPIGEFSWLRFLMQHMPVFAGVMFIPLAYWCRSRWIFRLGAIMVVYTLEANLIRSNLVVSSGGMAAIACALPPALLWAYQDFFWKLRPSATQLFSGIAHSLAITFLSVLFYFLSFYGIWNTSPVPSAQDTSPLLLPLLVDISILSSLTVWVWLQRVRLHQVDRITIFVVSMIAISAIVPFWHLSSGRIPSTAVWIFNLLLFLLGVGLIRKGLTQGQRRLFWGGMVLLTLQIFTRMLEYDTDLLFKSVVLLLCGFGVLAAGLWFERYLRVRR
ncbi:MAG: DUF2157 domain-containing protein [Coleofasciculus sp. Co-bin14]|nr:DUF2157 domain-containing protein [Coleofasciculus sp. Co-bin14]